MEHRNTRKSILERVTKVIENAVGSLLAPMEFENAAAIQLHLFLNPTL